ncbi:SURF1 family cytochrome oxidase biogenesis protein [Rothia sp. P5766]|uniref:SURF1 family cytochrome oxidase biogenesis protein n=1 Tax=Rothia sp. P5766 TaxID=3402656 RepID=UPI003AEAB4FF
MLKTALTPRWLLGLLLVLALSSGFVMLSKWQLNSSTMGQLTADPAKDRVDPYTEVLQPHSAQLASTVDTVVEARGTYTPGSSYLVENRLKDGVQGYWVIALFTPEDSQNVETSMGSSPRGIAVVRGWSKEPLVPPEPQGPVTVAGRIVANDPPVNSNQRHSQLENKDRLLGSASPAYLTNVWNAPLYDGILTLDSESTEGTPLADDGTIAINATIIGQTDNFLPVRAPQVTDENVDWLNIFYALEWLVFAGFALYLWYRMLKDAVEKKNDPALYFEYEGEYWVDEETGRPYYYDPADKTYYYFDEVQSTNNTESH